MDPVTLIVSALAAGTALGLSDTASSAVKDAYASLRSLVRKRLAGRKDGELVLARHAEDPKTWAAPLTAELTAAGADRDLELQAAAEALLSLVDAASKSGKYTITVNRSKGVQIGDHNEQTNVF